MQPCPFPALQLAHIASPLGTSVQMVNAARFDTAQLAVDIYGWSWQGMLPATFGAGNAGQSQWGDYGQSTVASVITPAIPGGNPAPTANGGGGGAGDGGAGGGGGGGGGGGAAASPSPGAAPAGSCPLGDMTAWSQCSLHCSGGASGSQSGGWQIQYRPIVVTPATRGEDISGCPLLAQRSAARTCTTRRQLAGQQASGTCGVCEDGLQNGAESDVDCGGGVTDGSIAGLSLNQYADLLRSRVGGDPAAAAAAVPTGASASTGACARCSAGRVCTAHEDCDGARGLLCLEGACAPWWFVNHSSFVDVTLALRGVELRDVHADSEAARSAMRTLLQAVADVASFGSLAGAGVPVHNVSALAWSGFRGSPVNDATTAPFWGLQRRALASVDLTDAAPAAVPLSFANADPADAAVVAALAAELAVQATRTAGRRSLVEAGESGLHMAISSMSMQGHHHDAAAVAEGSNSDSSGRQLASMSDVLTAQLRIAVADDAQGDAVARNLR